MSESGNTTIAPGTILAERYEVQEPIGHGGFGTVYRARQLNIDRDIAVKVLPPKFLTSTEVVERFRREAQLASCLRHPHTITIHDYGRHDDYLFIAMELLEGEDLADVLHREYQLPVDKIVHVATQVLKSLAEAHDRGIIHRDLKPENIFLSIVGQERDFVKVLDFGIAKFKAQDKPELINNPDDTNPFRKNRQLTMSGSTVGTPIYMSPEQAAGEEVDALSDLYALGIIMYEMASGRPPFYGENPVKIMRSHLFETVPQFTDPALRNSPLERIILKALDKDKSRRYQNAGEFLAALALEIDLSPHKFTQARPDTQPIPQPTPLQESPQEFSYDEEPPTLEMFAGALDSEPYTSSLSDTTSTSSFDFTPPTHDALRTTDPDLVFQNELDSVPFIEALDPKEAIRERAYQPASTASSILTILDTPPPESHEVLLLTRPKTVRSFPGSDATTGDFHRLRETPPAVISPISDITQTPSPEIPAPQLHQLREWGEQLRAEQPAQDSPTTNPPGSSRLLLIIAGVTLIIVATATLTAYFLGAF